MHRGRNDSRDEDQDAKNSLSNRLDVEEAREQMVALSRHYGQDQSRLRSDLEEVVEELQAPVSASCDGSLGKETDLQDPRTLQTPQDNL